MIVSCYTHHPLIIPTTIYRHEIWTSIRNDCFEKCGKNFWYQLTSCGKCDEHTTAICEDRLKNESSLQCITLRYELPSVEPEAQKECNRSRCIFPIPCISDSNNSASLQNQTLFECEPISTNAEWVMFFLYVVLGAAFVCLLIGYNCKRR